VLPELGGSEISELGLAFEEMRIALEGKEYVENYIQTLTHEIKAPLSALQGAVELLEEEMPPEQRSRFLRNAHVESERIQSIVEKLLLLATLEKRTTTQDEETVDLQELVTEVLESLKPVAHKKNISIERFLEEECQLEGERFLLYHAVLNLVTNALEFSSADSTIEVFLESDAGIVRFKVLDAGPGIPDYAQARVFERFFSVKRPDTGKKSSGLGLSLVQEAAELHGGVVSLQNRENGGVEAVLELPLEPLAT
jgi:two-component system sensor histidine kinase CreC